CCGGEKHATGSPMGRDDWYLDNLDKRALDRGWSKAQLNAQKRAYRALIKDAMARKGCTCAKPTKVLPEPPCDVFYGRQPDGTDQRKEQRDDINDLWNEHRPRFQFQQGLPKPAVHVRQLAKSLGRPPTVEELNKA